MKRKRKAKKDNKIPSQVCQCYCYEGKSGKEENKIDRKTKFLCIAEDMNIKGSLLQEELILNKEK